MARAVVVTGLTFGDEGKGTVTDWLTRSLGAGAVVRYNGGPQAGHNVVAPDGRWHCFAQLGAGGLVPETRTILGPRMLVEPETLEIEARVLAQKGGEGDLARVTVDPDCTVVTPMHKMLGQMAEVARGEDRVGTCGMGVGEAVRGREAGEGVTVAEVMGGGGLEALEGLVARALARARELARESPTKEMAERERYFRGRCDAAALHARYREILGRCRIAPAAEAIAEVRRPVVFEGAQGALLDREHGFVPFVTQSRTTLAPALELRRGEATTIGVVRAYGHRHGPGPLPAEDVRLARRLEDPHNRENRWQGRFRVGWLDLVALRYGVALNPGLQWLAVTGLDRLVGIRSVRVCTSYEFRGDLRALEPWARFEELGKGHARIVEILGQDGGLGLRATEVLGRCWPHDWIELSGWGAEISRARHFTDLPANARAFLERIETETGVPVGLASVSADAARKIAHDRLL